MRFKFLIVVFFIGAMAVSVLYAPLVYRTFLTTYYQKILKIDEAAFTKKIKDVYQSKQYDTLKELLDHGRILYPANRTLKKFEGLHQLAAGDVKGAFMLIALDDIPDDAHTIEMIMSVLDENASYNEVLIVADKKGIATAEMKYYYGKALVNTGMYRKGLSPLTKAYDHGIKEADYQIGHAHFYLKDYGNALIWYKKALARQPWNADYIRSIASVYRHVGDFKSSADYIMRLQR